MIHQKVAVFTFLLSCLLLLYFVGCLDHLFNILLEDTKVKGKVGGKELDSKDQDDRDSCTQVEDLSSINLRGFNNNSSTFVEQDNVGANLAPKKRQKLHWGYVIYF